eukprot:359555-Chlamydomonas_euryale.AAC.15
MQATFYVNKAGPILFLLRMQCNIGIKCAAVRWRQNHTGSTRSPYAQPCSMLLQHRHKISDAFSIRHRLRTARAELVAYHDRPTPSNDAISMGHAFSKAHVELQPAAQGRVTAGQSRRSMERTHFGDA